MKNITVKWMELCKRCQRSFSNIDDAILFKRSILADQELYPQMNIRNIKIIKR